MLASRLCGEAVSSDHFGPYSCKQSISTLGVNTEHDKTLSDCLIRHYNSFFFRKEENKIECRTGDGHSWYRIYTSVTGSGTDVNCTHTQ